MVRHGLLYRIFRENVGIKIISLLASFALFAAVRGSGDAQRTVSVEVQTVPPPASSNRILLTPIPDTVRVTLRGRAALLNRLSREPLAPVQVDLRDTTRRFYALDVDAFTLPPGVSATQIVPASIDLEWAERAEKRVPVIAVFSGRTPAGFEVRRPPRVEPSTVLVSGPVAEVRRIQQLQTESIDVGSFAAGAHSLQVPLERMRGHLSASDDGQVTVRFDIAPESEERLLRHVAVSAVGASARVEIRPARVDFVLRGPRTVMSSLDVEQVLATVDMNGVTEGAGSVLRPVQVRGLPENVDVVRINPAEVLVTE